MYFMTQESQDAVVGRLVHERAETKQHLAALHAQVKRIADGYRTLSEYLASKRSKVLLDGNSISMRVSDNSKGIDTPILTFDVAKIQELFADVKATSARLASLSERLKVFHID